MFVRLSVCPCLWNVPALWSYGTFSVDFSLRLDSLIFWTPWHQSVSTYSRPSFQFHLEDRWGMDECKLYARTQTVIMINKTSVSSAWLYLMDVGCRLHLRYIIDLCCGLLHPHRALTRRYLSSCFRCLSLLAYLWSVCMHLPVSPIVQPTSNLIVTQEWKRTTRGCAYLITIVYPVLVPGDLEPMTLTYEFRLDILTRCNLYFYSCTTVNMCDWHVYNKLLLTNLFTGTHIPKLKFNEKEGQSSGFQKLEHEQDRQTDTQHRQTSMQCWVKYSKTGI